MLSHVSQALWPGSNTKTPKNIPLFGLVILILAYGQQSCYLLPKFGSSPEFGVFQEIAQKIAQKILWYFKIGQKRPKKLPNDTKTLKKLPK